MNYNLMRAATNDHLHQILSLQKANLESSLSPEETEREGYVTCQHDFDLLQKMNHPDPHVICTYEDKVIGYALVMSPVWRDELCILQSMFEKIESLDYNGQRIKEDQYIVIGQVCIDQLHRGKGVFKKMYQYYKNQLSSKYNYCITEIATDNTRSHNAHYAMGFELLCRYQSEDGYSWEIVIWEWM